MASRVIWFGFLAYWLAVVVFTVYSGQFPGLMVHPELWEYPYAEVIAVCALLTLLLAAFYVILLPGKFPYSWRRVVLALAYATVLLVFGIASFATDLPGYCYVPVQFAFATLVGVVALAFFSIACALIRRGKRAA